MANEPPRPQPNTLDKRPRPAAVPKARLTADEIEGIRYFDPDRPPSAIRQFTDEQGIYSFRVQPPGVGFELSHVRRERHEVVGQLRVECDLPTARRTDSGSMFTADFNLSSARARVERAKLLADRARTTDIDWLLYLEEFCERVLEAQRTGDPAMLMADAKDIGPDALLECHGLPLLRDHPLILFGDGGCGKSYLALSMVGLLARQGMHVLYVDWEFRISDHKGRLVRLFGYPLPEIVHLRALGTLPEELDRIHGVMRQYQIRYCVFDSLAPAVTKVEASECANEYWRCLHSLNCGSLHIAHVNKGEHGDQKPFGSAFWHNGTRASWYVEASEQVGTDQPVQLGLHHRKWNTTGYRQPFALQMEFSGDRTIISPTEIHDVPSLAKKTSIAQQIVALVRRHPLTYAEIAEDIGAVEQSVRKKVSDHMKGDHPLFTVAKGADGRTRVSIRR